MTTIALNVPRARKDEAKALGARWNGFKKTWYVKVGTDLSPFKALGFYDVAEPAAPAAPVVTIPSSMAIVSATAAPCPTTRTIPLTKAEFLERGMAAMYPAGTAGNEVLFKDKELGAFKFEFNAGFYREDPVTGKLTEDMNRFCKVIPLTQDEKRDWCAKEMIWKDYEGETSIDELFAGWNRGYNLPEVTFEGIVFADETPTA
jgi:hypothetical protein